MQTPFLESNHSFRTIDDIIRFYSKARPVEKAPPLPAKSGQAPSPAAGPSDSKGKPANVSPNQRG